MIKAIMNLLLVLTGIGVTALWIAALADSDGKCRMDCVGCPFSGDCPEERNRKNENR